MIEKIVFVPYHITMALFGWAFDLLGRAKGEGWNPVRVAFLCLLFPLLAPAMLYVAWAEERDEQIKKKTGGFGNE